MVYSELGSGLSHWFPLRSNKQPPVHLKQTWQLSPKPVFCLPSPMLNIASLHACVSAFEPIFFPPLFYLPSSHQRPTSNLCNVSPRLILLFPLGRQNRETLLLASRCLKELLCNCVEMWPYSRPLQLSLWRRAHSKVRGRAHTHSSDQTNVKHISSQWPVKEDWQHQWTWVHVPRWFQMWKTEIACWSKH